MVGDGEDYFIDDKKIDNNGITYNTNPPYYYLSYYFQPFVIVTDDPVVMDKLLDSPPNAKLSDRAQDSYEEQEF